MDIDIVVAPPSTTAAPPPQDALLHWRYAPFAVCWVDQDKVLQYTYVKSLIRYPNFLAVIHELTTLDAHKLPGLPVHLEPGEGLGLRDGLWSYRFCHAGLENERIYNPSSGWRTTYHPHERGEWIVMEDSQKGFYRLLNGFVATRQDTNSWVEIAHHLQFRRNMEPSNTRPYRRQGPLVIDGSKKAPQQSLPNEFAIGPSTSVLPRGCTFHQQFQSAPVGVVPPPQLMYGAQQTMNDPMEYIAGSGYDVRFSQPPVFHASLPYRNQMPMMQSMASPAFQQSDQRFAQQVPLPYQLVPKMPTIDLNSCDDTITDPGLDNIMDNERRTCSHATNPFPEDSQIAGYYAEGENWGRDGGQSTFVTPQHPHIASGSPINSPYSQDEANLGILALATYHDDRSTRRGVPRQQPKRQHSDLDADMYDADSAPSALDPALEINQGAELPGMHRTFRAYRFEPKGRRPLKEIVGDQHSRDIATRGVPQDVSAVARNSSPLSSPPASDSTSPPAKRNRKGNFQYNKRKIRQREAAHNRAVADKATKEREKVQETLDKQRDERKKRAERRESLKG